MTKNPLNFDIFLKFHGKYGLPNAKYKLPAGNQQKVTDPCARIPGHVDRFDWPIDAKCLANHVLADFETLKNHLQINLSLKIK